MIQEGCEFILLWDIAAEQIIICSMKIIMAFFITEI
jgi:hypothetical protein